MTSSLPDPDRAAAIMSTHMTRARVLGVVNPTSGETRYESDGVSRNYTTPPGTMRPTPNSTAYSPGTGAAIIGDDASTSFVAPPGVTPGAALPLTMTATPPLAAVSASQPALAAIAADRPSVSLNSAQVVSPTQASAGVVTPTQASTGLTPVTAASSPLRVRSGAIAGTTSPITVQSVDGRVVVSNRDN
jgi:hypothetical protein